MYRKNLLKGSCVLAGDRQVSLIPLKRPPSCMQVKKWLKVKTELEETKKSETEDKSEKLERLIIVASSPGQDYGSDEEQNTLVLTPMSLTSRIHSTPSDCPPGTSLSLTDTPLGTPVPLAPGRRTKRKSSDILKKSFAKLLKNYAAMSSIQENEADAAHAQK
ncbi:uncharacterized protein LOC120355217 [Nilaparvata lugens]|uniref:uncharacterized protein LOC120355217 n=1 Tax=Nilaparvata lugens TaxID=108931 RepID=UPI00193EC11D|nr:uncharacterized protein LOC120355217 [Nilaparvata lugens]